jgi:3'-5' exoribonuclease
MSAAAAALPDPRAWIGHAPFPWPAAATLHGGAAVNACYALVNVTTLRTRQEKPYLRLQLVDRFGPIEGRVWDGADEIAARLRPGVYVGVRGRLEIFNGERQLKVDEIGQIRVPLEDLELFLPRSRRAAAAMDDELRRTIESVRDAPLRALLERLLAAESDIGQGFRLAPAAKYNHHAYLGGLLEHSLSVAALCDKLAAHYGDDVDRDLLVTAALLHDIGKISEIGAQAGFPYTDEGKLLGHILLGLQMVHAAGTAVPELRPERLLLVEHLVASHQGRYEWQSPREPRILEGLILHYADDLDAKVAQVAALLERTDAGWTAYDRSFQREFLRHLHEGSADSREDADAAAGVDAGAGYSADAGALDRADTGLENADTDGVEPGGSADPRHGGGESGGGGRLDLDRDSLDLFDDSR